MKEIKQVNEAQTYERIHLVKQDGSINVVDVNTGRVLAKEVKTWTPQQWKKFFREWGVMNVEVKTDDKTFIRNGSYSPKRFLSLISRYSPQQGQTVPLVKGEPYAFTEDNKPFPIQKLLKKLLEGFVRKQNKCLQEANYKGQKVQLNKPFLSKKNKEKVVFIKEENVVRKVRFGNKE